MKKFFRLLGRTDLQKHILEWFFYNKKGDKIHFRMGGKVYGSENIWMGIFHIWTQFGKRSSSSCKVCPSVTDSSDFIFELSLHVDSFIDFRYLTLYFNWIALTHLIDFRNDDSMDS